MKNSKAILAALLIGASPAAWAQYNAGTNDLAQTNLGAALADFTTAAASSPNDPAANVYLAYTRLLNIPSQTPASNFLTGWGLSPEGRDVFDWSAKFQTQPHGRMSYPGNQNVDDVTAQLRANVLPALAAAEANLAQITNTMFTLFLPGSVTHLGDVTLDYGDALMLRAILYAQMFSVYTLNSWNVDGTVSAISNYNSIPVSNSGAGKQGIEGVLNGFPDALTFATTNDFQAAQGAFTNAINNYLAASQFIRSRPADTRRLFNLDAGDAAAEQEFRAKITGLENSLVAPVAFNGDTNHMVSMAAYFSAKHSPRSLLPQFTNNTDFVWDSVPDPTFGGLVTGFTAGDISKFLVSRKENGFNAELSLPGVHFTDLRELADDNFSGPPNGVVQGADGNLYGTFAYGGANGNGLVFKVAPSTGDLTILYQFGMETNDDGSYLDGSNPNNLIVGSNGNLYGTTYYGGENWGGTVFMLNPKNSQLTTLWNFGTDDDGGASESASALVWGKDGNLYGSASAGGPNNGGIIFRMAPSATAPNFQLLYSFGAVTDPDTDQPLDGEYPNTLIQGMDGNFYGTTQTGGAYGFGTIFEISPADSLTNFATLYSFGAVQDEFGNPLDGNNPNALVQGGNGVLYGTTQFGGSNDVFYQSSLSYEPPLFPPPGYGDGVLFSITTNGAFTNLYSFDQNPFDGFTPVGAMARGTNGNFFGTTYAGGANGRGTIFTFQPGGIPQFIVWFSKGLGGRPMPVDGLVAGATPGVFYGATAVAHDGSGTVFRFGAGTNPVITPPFIIVQPVGANCLVSNSVTLTVTAGGAAPLHYQWGRVGAVLPVNATGATSNILTLANLKLANSGSYFVVVTNAGGSVTSTVAALTVLQGPTIAGTPKVPSGILQGQALSLTVAATGSGLIYEWLDNNVILTDNGFNISGSATSNLVINPAYTTNSGSYKVVVSNAIASATSGVFTVTVSADTVAPGVAITSPAKDGTRSNAVLWTFSGTASDNVRVTNVNYWITNLNGAPLVGPIAANLTAGSSAASPSNWTAIVSPPAGSNVFAAQSRDFSGNPSPIASRKFFVKSPVMLTLKTAGTGSGTFKGTNFISGETNVPANNAMLNVGESYSITAIPDAHSFFEAWTGTADMAYAPTLNFIMESNTSITAYFITNMFLGMAGTYNGLFASYPVAEETAGMISGLILKTNGVFGGTLYLDGASPGISGTFSSEGYWSNLVPVGPHNNVKVELSVDSDIAPRMISGAVIGTNQGGWASEVMLVAGLTNSSQLAGKFTMLIPWGASSAPANPPGYGYALLSNAAATATVNMTGFMADGTAISQSMPIGEDGGITIYPSPYNTGTNGMLFGRIYFVNTPILPNPSGSLTWIKKQAASGSFKAGFTNSSIEVEGSPWSPSMPLTNVIPAGSPLIVAGGGLTNALSLDVSVANKTNLAPAGPAPNYASGSVNTNNGQFTVSFTNNARVVVTGRGALLQDIRFGAGFFASPTNNPTNFGSITLGVAP